MPAKSSQVRNSQRYVARLKMQIIKCWKLIQTWKGYDNISRIAKMLSLYHRLYEKKARTSQTSLDRYFTKKQIMLILTIPNVLNHSLLSIY